MIESKLNGCFWVLLLHWDLEIFIGEVPLLHPHEVVLVICYYLDAYQINFDSKYNTVLFVNIEKVNRVLLKENFWRVAKLF